MKDTILYFLTMLAIMATVMLTIIGAVELIHNTALRRANKSCAFAGYNGAVADYQYHPIYCYDLEDMVIFEVEE